MSSEFRRTWFVPMALLLTIATTVFFCLYTVDHYWTGGPPTVRLQNMATNFVCIFTPKLTAAPVGVGSVPGVTSIFAKSVRFLLRSAMITP